MTRPLSLAAAQHIISETPVPRVPAARGGSRLAVETSRGDAGRPNLTHVVTRDLDGAVVITEAQAAGPLPAGRYRVADTAGRIVAVIERGESWCAEGRRLVQQRRGVNAARQRIEHEHAVQESWFSESRGGSVAC